MVNSVALQLSGRLRYTNNSISSLMASIIELYQPDIFCSFWTPAHIETVDHINKYISPKLLEIEDLSLLKPLISIPETYENLPYMSYKFYKVSKIRQSYEITNGKKYDIVIQARTDTIFFEKLSIPHAPAPGIYSSKDSYCRDIDDAVSPRMADNFYLGDTFNMDVAAKTFFQLKNTVEELNSKKLYHQSKIPEVVQSLIWNKNKIPIYSLPGNNPFQNFWYDIDRQETEWK